MAASNFKDETGKRFGQLTVIRRAENDNAGKARWLCQCDCGNKCTVSGHNLRLRPNITCGCYRRRQSGLSDTAEYHSWHSMIGRCNNPKSISFHNYGERGISVCHEWYEFKTFLSDMGEMPRKGYSLDRIDNNGNYEPSNCRWATRQEQDCNKRTNRYLSIEGKTKTITQWANEYNISYQIIAYRLKSGWTVKRAVTQPKGSYRKKKSPRN